MIACTGTSKNLSRGDALAKLQVSPQQMTKSVAAQTYVPCAQRADYEGHNNNMQLVRIWDILVSKGVADLRDSVVSPARKGFGALVNCTFRLNAEGIKHVGTAWAQHDIGLGHFEYTIPTGVLYPIEVTGVAQNGDAQGAGGAGGGSAAQVEFRWEWRPSSSSDLFASPKEFPKYTGAGVAIFQRYDDGWRMMSSSYGIAAHS